jgi:hypothetical protein
MTLALDLVFQAALMAVVALGAWTAMGEGMLMERFARLVERIAPAWIAKPISSCPRCMCSAWGITALLLCGFGVGVSWNFDLGILALDWSRIAQLPMLILAAVGIQEMLHRP